MEMGKKGYEELICNLKKEIGSLPQKLDDYVKKGDEYFDNGNFDVAAGIFNLASQVAPAGHCVHEKRLNAIEGWIKEL